MMITGQLQLSMEMLNKALPQLELSAFVHNCHLHASDYFRVYTKAGGFVVSVRWRNKEGKVMSEIRGIDFNSDILRKVERELGPLDKRAREAVLRGLELAFKKGEPPKPAIAWQGENPTYAEAERLSLSERSRRMGELEAQNQTWLERKCEELGASWLIVVDGEVLAHGATLADYVTDDALLKWCEQTGKLPLVYEHPRLLTIEESAPWHLTAYPQDAYPTLKLALVGNGSGLQSKPLSEANRADFVADFDTGSLETYVNLDSLRAQGIVQIAPMRIKLSILPFPLP
jgi:hypothetical protein